MMPWLGRDYVEQGNGEAIAAQTRRFRRWRPWMWGPLHRLWHVVYEQAAIGTLWGPDRYTWMWRRDHDQARDGH